MCDVVWSTEPQKTSHSHPALTDTTCVERREERGGQREEGRERREERGGKREEEKEEGRERGEEKGRKREEGRDEKVAQHKPFYVLCVCVCIQVCFDV